MKKKNTDKEISNQLPPMRKTNRGLRRQMTRSSLVRKAFRRRWPSGWGQDDSWERGGREFWEEGRALAKALRWEKLGVFEK